MGLFDKVKNLFTEEVEEEIKPIKRETRFNEVKQEKPSISQPEKVVPVPTKPEIEEKEEKKEEKFVFFSDDDFKDLEKPKKVEIKREPVKPTAYNGATIKTTVEPRKEFTPSPIISPVYGVLDHNYKKEDIPPRKVTHVKNTDALTIDDVRNKAYGSLEDDLKDNLLGKTEIVEEVKEPEINIFDELEKYDDVELSKPTSEVDEIFDQLDGKKEEIIEEIDTKKDETLDELDNKKVEILDELDTKKKYDLSISDDDLTSDVDIAKEMLEEDEDIDVAKEDNEEINIAKEMLDDEETEEELDTDALAKELEEQKKKLEEISSMMNENEKATKTNKGKKKEESEDDLDESELFDLIDTMYEKKDDE